MKMQTVLFEEPLPEEAQPMEEILHVVENRVFANATPYLPAAPGRII